MYPHWSKHYRTLPEDATKTVNMLSFHTMKPLSPNAHFPRWRVPLYKSILPPLALCALILCGTARLEGMFELSAVMWLKATGQRRLHLSFHGLSNGLL